MREGGREGELECLTPREHAALDGVVVHLCVCLCICMPRECDELHWPWPGASLSIVFVAELTKVGGGGYSCWGHDSLCPPRECQCEQSLLNLAFVRFHLPFGYAFSLELRLMRKKSKNLENGNKELKM